jgi:predicted transcriptional regulator
VLAWAEGPVTGVGGTAGLRWRICQLHRRCGRGQEQASSTERTLTIALQPDWRAALRQAAKKAQATCYQGETLNFETLAAFFGRLTERRWALVTALLGQGTLAVRELARRVGRDVKRVHEDVQVLAELGLVERDEAGGVLCPCTDVHTDMHVQHERAAA